MRIACLQFTPLVGDVDNNLNRADAVLAKANQEDLDSLDLIVLPELAFSGHKFGSVEEVEPYLEPSRSGISSLWARTVALKHNTNVVVGYPEKVDGSRDFRSRSKYYNSAILVNGDGETIANYRKASLDPVDETWAHEGREFYGDRLPGLDHTAIGIGADIKPHQLQAPWHAFEFAFHVLEVRANLVILTMAWITEEDCERFTQFPNEPDLEALTYWVRRLEPVIRDESRDEIVFVFCNRTGIEGASVYSGTSAVIGIHQGEVKVYGLLGRGVKDLLVVDTDDPPLANLILRGRGKTVLLSPTQYELRTSGQDTCETDDLLLRLSPADDFARAPAKYLLRQQVSKSQLHNTRHETFSTPSASSNSSDTVSSDSDSNSRAEQGQRQNSKTSATPLPSRRPWIARPASSSVATKPTIHIKSPGAGHSQHEAPKQSAPSFLPKENTSRSSHDGKSTTEHSESPIVEKDEVPVRPSTATGVLPARPASPKFRNASRPAQHSRDGLDEQQEILTVAGQRRSQSVMARRQDHDTMFTQRKSPSPGAHETRAVLWTEISELLGHHLERFESDNGSRGRALGRSGTFEQTRQPAIDGPPSAIPIASSETKAGSRRQSPNGLINVRADSRQGRPVTRNEDQIRTIRAPSLGPPSDSEDEIVAEIFLRRRPCLNCGSENCRSAGPPASPTESISSTAAQIGFSSSRGSSPEGVQRQRALSDDESQGTPTNKKLAESGRGPELRLPSLQTSTGVVNELKAPDLSRTSSRTMSPHEAAPITPSPRDIAPPKLMSMVVSLSHGAIPTAPINAR